MIRWRDLRSVETNPRRSGLPPYALGLRERVTQAEGIGSGDIGRLRRISPQDGFAGGFVRGLDPRAIADDTAARRGYPA